MDLTLARLQFDSDVTIGRLTDKADFLGWVCEDTVRPPGVKVKHLTAIPFGRYKIIIDFSNRFQCLMPLLLNVPMYEGIRIHPGNKAVDTDGCLLPGLVRLPKGVGESRLAYRALYNKIAAELGRANEVWIDIVDGR